VRNQPPNSKRLLKGPEPIEGPSKRNFFNRHRREFDLCKVWRTVTEEAIKMLLIEIQSKLNETARTAKAAEACAFAASLTAYPFRWISSN
jgi:hypothetical protein